MKIKRMLSTLMIVLIAVGNLSVSAIAGDSGFINSGTKQTFSLGYEDGAVIKEDGSLWVWGSNENGQLGVGKKIKISATPVKIMDNVKAVSFGDFTSGAIKEDGSLWMWGNNENGQLLNGTTEDSYVPVKVMEQVKEVSIKGSCAVIKEDGSLWTWGGNGWGTLGNGKKTASTAVNAPTKIMDNVKKVTFGWYTGGAIKEDGSLWMWGTNRYNGLLGDGRADGYSYTPIKIMENVKAFSLGYLFGAAIKEDGTLWMWGAPKNGILGNKKVESCNSPIKMMDNVKAVSLSHIDQNAVIKEDGSLWMWGENYAKSVGVESPERVLEPVKVMENVEQVALGYYQSGAIKTDGSLWMWGSKSNGQLGVKNIKENSLPIQILKGVKLSGNNALDTTASKELKTEQTTNVDYLSLDTEYTEFSEEEKEMAQNALKELIESGAISPMSDSVSVTQSSTYEEREAAYNKAGFSENQKQAAENYVKELGFSVEDAIARTIEINVPVNKPETAKMITLEVETTHQVSTKKAVPTSSTVYVNGKSAYFDAYNIDGNNYFKIRDVAAAINGTTNQFEVNYDSEDKSVKLFRNTAYTTVGGELSKGSGAVQTAVSSNFVYYKDGNKLELTSYLIGGNNYIKLVDIGKIFSFGIGWEQSSSSVAIISSVEYNERNTVYTQAGLTEYQKQAAENYISGDGLSVEAAIAKTKAKIPAVK